MEERAGFILTRMCIQLSMQINEEVLISNKLHVIHLRLFKTFSILNYVYTLNVIVDKFKQF